VTASRVRRVAIRAGAVLGAVIAALGLVVWVFFRTFYPSPPAPAYPPPADIAAAQRQDLDYFRHYFDLEKSWPAGARERAMAMWTDIDARAGTFTPAQFALSIARIVALADNGHSNLYAGPLSRAFNRLPCRLYRFADGYYVIRAKASCAPLLGARLTGIDGQPVERIVDGMKAYVGGTRNHFDQFGSLFYLESPALLHAAGYASADDRVTLQLRLQDGAAREAVLVADPPDAKAPRVFSDRYLAPQPIDGESREWKPLLAADSAMPLFLRDYDNPFHSESLDGSQTYYAQFRSNADEPRHPIGEFIARIEREIAATRPRRVIVDLRLDQGGNFTKTASLMKRLPTLVDSIGHVAVLTSAWTFSAGDVSLALLKDRGGAKVNIVGETAGDRIRIWAEGGELVLPNSRLALGFATGLHDYSKPCFGETGCFWVMYFYPTHVTSFVPDTPVAYTFADYVAGRDPLLARAMATPMP
jgi:hypothetical protein